MTSNVNCALAQKSPTIIAALNLLKKTFVSLDSATDTNASTLFMLLNNDINQHVTLTAANVPKTMKMMNKS